MRIVAGKYRHRIIDMTNLDSTRETQDSVREAIFNMIGPYFDGGICLDLFSGSGAMALEAYSRGMDKIYINDINKKALDVAINNTKKLGILDASFYNLDYLSFIEKIDIKFDLIILDPPAFTKSKDTLKKAYKGYKEINLQAIKAIKKGGYLFTFSCSQHMTPELFLQMIKESIIDSKRKAQFIEFKVQSPDHPSLFSSEEQLYLKCVILRIL